MCPSPKGLPQCTWTHSFGIISLLDLLIKFFVFVYENSLRERKWIFWASFFTDLSNSEHNHNAPSIFRRRAHTLSDIIWLNVVVDLKLATRSSSLPSPYELAFGEHWNSCVRETFEKRHSKCLRRPRRFPCFSTRNSLDCQWKRELTKIISPKVAIVNFTFNALWTCIMSCNLWTSHLILSKLSDPKVSKGFKKVSERFAIPLVMFVGYE